MFNKKKRMLRNWQPKKDLGSHQFLGIRKAIDVPKEIYHVMGDTHASSATLSNYAVHVGHKRKENYLHVTGANGLLERVVTADGLVEHASTERTIAHTTLKMVF